MDRFVRHRQPEEKDVRRKHHELQLRTNTEGTLAIGRLEYFGRPFPMYYVSAVASFQEGKGNGGQLVRELNAFLKERGAAGLLISRVGTLYEREGWQRVSGQEDWWSFNLPATEPTEIARAIRRIEIHES